MDDEDFLAAVEADNANTPVEEPKEPEAPEPEAAEPAPEPAPAEPEPAAPANPLVAPVVEAKPDPGFVPITVVLDTRDKLKAANEELARFRAAQEQQQPPKVPDMFEDPDGFAAYQSQAAQQATLNAKLDISEEMARDKFGDELVDQARDWALQQSQNRPGFYQELIRQRNPYRYAVEQFQREQIASQVSPTDYAEFQAWKAAQAALQAAPPAQAAPATPPPSNLPPRSLASAPSAGSVTTEVEPTEEEIFAETFSRK